MSAYARLLKAIGSRRWFAAVASKIAPPLDRLVYRLSRGRRLATPTSVPTFFLTTIGRRTGRRRTVPVSFVVDNGDYVIVGTNWGKRTTPDWTLNLSANPRASIETHREAVQVDARLVPEDDRARIWDALIAIWPPYATYRERAQGRDVAMFRLVRI
jgi:deazaflavin-dependent oxidoreductase (nitroreductase family)